VAGANNPPPVFPVLPKRLLLPPDPKEDETFGS
jgi:hypothetical protein